MGLDVEFNVAFYRESGRVIAHALEFDLIGDGETREDALECLAKAIAIQAEFAMENPNAAEILFRQAPPEIATKAQAFAIRSLRIAESSAATEPARPSGSDPEPG